MWSRFAAALRKELVENRNVILLVILGMYVLLTLLMINANITYCLDEQGLVNRLKNYVPQKKGYDMLVVSCIVTASLAFRSLKSKKGRASLFTLPASTLEKFLVNVTIYVVGFFAMYHVCAQLADLTRIAVLWSFRGDRIVVPGPLNYMNLVNDTVTGMGTSLVAGMTTVLSVNLLSVLAMFLMGSILWPRLSLVKTFIVFEGIFVFLGMGNLLISTIGFGGGGIPNWLWNLDLWALSAWYIIEAIVFGALAWYLFKRKDVVSTRWWS